MADGFLACLVYGCKRKRRVRNAHGSRGSARWEMSVSFGPRAARILRKMNDVRGQVSSSLRAANASPTGTYGAKCTFYRFVVSCEHKRKPRAIRAYKMYVYYKKFKGYTKEKKESRKFATIIIRSISSSIHYANKYTNNSRGDRDKRDDLSPLWWWWGGADTRSRT